MNLSFKIEKYMLEYNGRQYKTDKLIAIVLNNNIEIFNSDKITSDKEKHIRQLLFHSYPNINISMQIQKLIETDILKND